MEKTIYVVTYGKKSRDDWEREFPDYVTAMAFADKKVDADNFTSIYRYTGRRDHMVLIIDIL